MDKVIFRFVAGLVAGIGITLILWLAGSSVEATLRISEWDLSTRKGMSIIWIMGLLFVWAIASQWEIPKEDKS